MDTEFQYTSPQFIDFTNEQSPDDKKKIEAYFDCQNEDRPIYPKEEIMEISDESIATLEELKTDMEEEEEDAQENATEQFFTPIHEVSPAKMRYSMSVPDLTKVFDQETTLVMEELKVEQDDLNLVCGEISASVETLTIADDIPNQPPATTRQSRSRLTPRLNKSSMLRTRSSSGNRNTQGIGGGMQPLPTVNKYVSMQEAIFNFERRTPVRFHTRSASATSSQERLCGPLPATIPQSPALLTRARSRPVLVISQQEREQQEIAEIRKFKIKAHPVNRKVLGPVKPVHVEKKPCTQPQPFHLTEAAKKPSVEPQETFEFHAREMPRFSSPKLRPAKIAPTVPKTPNVLKKMPHRLTMQCQPETAPPKEWKPELTVVQPFSFDKQLEQMKRRREQLIQRKREEEARMREFHAKPVPKKVFDSPAVKVKLTKGGGSLESLKSTGSEGKKSGQNNVDGVKFKARPPTSLLAKPFIPKKIERPLVEISEFELNTEKRSREREAFRQRQEQREREQEELQKERDELDLQKIEEDLKAKRKASLFKAQPIRKFKSPPKVDPRPLTMPHSPKFQTRYGNKENVKRLSDV